MHAHIVDSAVPGLDCNCFFGGHCKTVRPIGPSSVLSVCPVRNVGAQWPNGWTDQDETWHGGRPRPSPNCVDIAPLPFGCTGTRLVASV